MRLTRPKVLGITFLVLGILLALYGAVRIDPTQRTTLGVGTLGTRDVPAQASLVLIGLITSLGGILALFERLRRALALTLVTVALLDMLALMIWAARGSSVDLVGMLAASLRMATPIALGSLAGIWCERSGVINIGIEGMMLAAAAFGFAVNLYLSQWLGPRAIWIGLLAAVLTGGVMAFFHAVLSIRFKTDQIISGTAINILAVGASGFLRRAYLVKAYFVGEILPIVNVPLLADIPILGAIFFQNRPIVYMMLTLVVLTNFILFFTAWGLRTRAVGEHPLAADTVGIDVFKTRYINVVIGGLMAGLAGGWFSLETVGSFEDLMTGGKGFIALAAMIFGNWTPYGAFLGALLFGFAEALEIKLQILDAPIPHQFLTMVPYFATMIVLAGLIGRTVPPAADGRPYEKQ
ncbi:MAG: ABC transporter permease [Chloroflexi bacterium]|nr:ABC transporter permease [Chloroflexota bacterium]